MVSFPRLRSEPFGLVEGHSRCEYIAFRSEYFPIVLDIHMHYLRAVLDMWRIGYARISHGHITDTELQVRGSSHASTNYRTSNGIHLFIGREIFYRQRDSSRRLRDESGAVFPYTRSCYANSLALPPNVPRRRYKVRAPELIRS
jgi:hypothetical protein